MKTLVLIAMSVLFVVTVACNKSDVPSKKVVAGMSSDMSDEQLLRVMKRDPKKMMFREERGDDGSSFVYSDTEEVIIITRSDFSGVTVLRHIKKTDIWQTWILGLP